VTGKRANGEGSLVRRRNRTWLAIVSLPDGRRKYLYAKTRDEARRKLTRALGALEAGAEAEVRGDTVGEFLDLWLNEVVKPNVRPWTYRGYEVHVRMHLKPLIGHIPLARLGALDVQKALNRKSADGLKPKSIRYIRGTLRAALNHAVKWGLIEKNPAAVVAVPRVEPYEIRPFTPAEARMFLNAIKGDRLEALYSVALTMGLRQGEALGLRWRDIDLELGYVRVTKQLQRLDGRSELVEPKTSRSRRQIAMPKSICVSLQEHRVRQDSERKAAGDRWTDLELVFSTSRGKPLDATAVTKDFHRLLDSAGLAQRRFHDLRHSCATLLLVQGVAPRVVMDVLGHSQIAMTMNTYSHVIPELRRTAADRMDDLLNDR
jgi:integrase